MELKDVLTPVGVLLVVMVVSCGIGYMGAAIVDQRRRRHLHGRLRRLLVPSPGTRPRVLLEVDEITYDVSDTLVRVRNDKCECALWVVVGPPHVLITDGTVVAVHLQHPKPARTHLSLEVKPLGDGTARFVTAQEIEDIL